MLAAEMHPDGGLQQKSPALAMLTQTALPVIVVVRIDGQLTPISSTALLSVLRTLLQQFRDAGVVLCGIEIDHDCASVQLRQYGALLNELRQALPTDLRLSITALPT